MWTASLSGKLDRGSPVFMQDNTPNLSMRDDLQVLALHNRLKESRCSTMTLAVFGGQLQQTHSFLPGAIEVGIVGKAILDTSLYKGLPKRRPKPLRILHLKFPAISVIGIVDILIVFGSDKVGKYLAVRPTRITRNRPVVVVGRITSYIRHSIGRTTASQSFAPG